MCATSDWVGAYDATSGEGLWQLSDEAGTRIAPDVTGAWHGAVYAWTANGALVLAARAGADREVASGVAPYLVNEHIGIADAPGGNGLAAFRATG
ncbi:hypothetical protein [Phytomonospora endophytica]|uniref:Uncharacterized protein n=1 Tax=Phytomonospora endophytica TaxID=714109 RepID=A0A841FNS8_9ACTN|nr:hypothetical protein [Phytomonospora endophytica]MBB6037756.1 hypothetical protein [Phytomonospora endophytica]GIG67715.1 hypothetical protein Pen01_40100 [Phytomonospora endophytica]